MKKEAYELVISTDLKPGDTIQYPGHGPKKHVIKGLDYDSSYSFLVKYWIEGVNNWYWLDDSEYVYRLIREEDRQ